MATLTPKLTLTGSAADFGAALSLSVEDTLTVTDPSRGLSKISATTVGSAAIITDTAATTKYVYIRHTGKDASDSATAVNVFVQDTDDVNIGELAPEEWCFFPKKSNSGVQLEAASGTVVCEYAYFTKG